MYIGHYKYTSVGLGESDGVFQSLRFRSVYTKPIKRTLIQILPVIMLYIFHNVSLYNLATFSIILNIHDSSELFRHIRTPYCKRYSHVMQTNKDFFYFSCLKFAVSILINDKI